MTLEVEYSKINQLSDPISDCPEAETDIHGDRREVVQIQAMCINTEG